MCRKTLFLWYCFSGDIIAKALCNSVLPLATKQAVPLYAFVFCGQQLLLPPLLLPQVILQIFLFMSMRILYALNVVVIVGMFAELFFFSHPFFFG